MGDDPIQQQNCKFGGFVVVCVNTNYYCCDSFTSNGCFTCNYMELTNDSNSLHAILFAWFRIVSSSDNRVMITYKWYSKKYFTEIHSVE